MTIRSYSLLGFVALFFLATSPASSQRPSIGGQTHTWKSIRCKGLRQTVLGYLAGDLSAKTDKSTDQMIITRNGQSLNVQTNQVDVAHSLGKKLVETDVYQISSVSKEGIAAVHGYGPYPTVHTLVINADGRTALWTESGLNWVAPHNPTSNVVLFACTKE
ncbi:MAG: hypothetical protein JSS87_07405 [Acidobacteria bacterium]|nr:hypothetical protein [Acidobacteriota bacterium]